jgi:hypothetical protein
MQKEDKERGKETKQNTQTLKYKLIDTIFDCIKTVEEILLKESIMALDCEGVLLSKEGRLTLLQVSQFKLMT